MKVYVNLKKLAIARINPETPFYQGADADDKIRVMFDQQPTDWIPMLYFKLPTGRKYGPVFAAGLLEGETRVIVEGNKNYYYYDFMLSTETGILANPGQLQMTLALQHADEDGNAIAEEIVGNFVAQILKTAIATEEDRLLEILNHLNVVPKRLNIIPGVSSVDDESKAFVYVDDNGSSRKISIKRIGELLGDTLVPRRLDGFSVLPQGADHKKALVYVDYDGQEVTIPLDDLSSNKIHIGDEAPETYACDDLWFDTSDVEAVAAVSLMSLDDELENTTTIEEELTFNEEEETIETVYVEESTEEEELTFNEEVETLSYEEIELVEDEEELTFTPDEEELTFNESTEEQLSFNEDDSSTEEELNFNEEDEELTFNENTE